MERGEPAFRTHDADILLPDAKQPNQLAAQLVHDRLSEQGSNAGLTKKRGADWEPPLHFPAPLEYQRSEALDDGPCDPNHPRVFHMFWTGPFTDKPYLALMSFLFSQNLGLYQTPGASQQPTVCRPQFWMWINPGPAAAVANPDAHRQMFDQLRSSPWASPFLHPRFKDLIHFKMWNTTEQLDGVAELKDEWRAYQDSLFTTAGHIIGGVAVDKNGSSPANRESGEEVDGAVAEQGSGTKSAPVATGSANIESKKEDDDLQNRMGSKSSSSYDRLSVILSDLARFVLCHRFGGIYLDADVILLRDWEELWGWKGAFAYRWSRLETYNTAVLHMNKGSAVGSFLFRTALRNGLDFHPMTVAEYTKDAYLEGLLLRLPDALFDPAWLNTEEYQRDRPPQPYFTSFVF